MYLYETRESEPEGVLRAAILHGCGTLAVVPEAASSNIEHDTDQQTRKIQKKKTDHNADH